MLSVKWLREQIPDSRPALAAPGLSGLAGDVENETTARQRRRAVEDRPVETLTAILKAVEATLDKSIAMQKFEPGSRGGPKPLDDRRDLIIMLAIKWQRLGKRVSTGRGSDFVAFVVNVMDSIGWPSDLDTETGEAITSAISKALGHWRNLTKDVVR